LLSSSQNVTELHNLHLRERNKSLFTPSKRLSKGSGG
jgi:hypothetical protein